MKRIVIVGASSGIGEEAARIFASKGYKVGIAARREDRLAALAAQWPECMTYQAIDVTDDDAAERFSGLISKNGGMDILLYTAGTGWNNPTLDAESDIQTNAVNVKGFTAITEAAFRYFRDRRQPGQIAAITSIAGTKGLGVSASYSASKRYQWSMLQSFDQLAHIQRLPIKITDIRPGFVDTALLSDATRRYPMMMTVRKAARLVVKAVECRRRVAVIDRRWHVLTALWSLIPNWLWPYMRLKG